MYFVSATMITKSTKRISALKAVIAWEDVADKAEESRDHGAVVAEKKSAYQGGNNSLQKVACKGDHGHLLAVGSHDICHSRVAASVTPDVVFVVF